MNKRFLLVAYDTFYPGGGDNDWVGVFETREAALAYAATNYKCKEADNLEVIDLWEWTGQTDDPTVCRIRGHVINET